MAHATLLIDDHRLRLERIETAPYGTNAYLATCRATDEAVLIDAPAEAEEIAARLGDTVPRYILVTHNHADHVGALRQLHERWRASVAAHPDDFAGLPVSPEVSLRDGDRIPVGRLELKALHTPGHTPGSLCFWLDGVLLAGDTLFPGGPGKTRSAEDFRRLIASLESKVFVLPGDTVVYPGHGEGTTVAREREAYAVFAARPADPDLHGEVSWSLPRP